jgi:hypothetical protein
VDVSIDGEGTKYALTLMNTASRNLLMLSGDDILLGKGRNMLKDPNLLKDLIRYNGKGRYNNGSCMLHMLCEWKYSTNARCRPEVN